MNWTKMKVKDFAQVISGGTPSTNILNFWGGDIYWITPKDLSGYKARFISHGERNISEEGLLNSSARLLPKNTVLLTTRAPIGYVAISENELATNQGFKNLICNEEIAHFEFVYYMLKNSKELLESHATGSTFKELPSERLKEIYLPIPPLIIQKKIASILSPYDSLLENNRRRIQLLEQSARLLYREWFVHLRFPGHEHVRMIDGVPEGWEVKQLSELCHIARGASPRPINDYMGGNVPWFKIGDATASESPFVFETKEKVTEDGARMSRTLPPGSFILSNSATCGIPYFTGVEGCIHDGWLCFWDFKRINKFFLYCFLHFKQRELLTIVCDGSTQKNLNTNIVGGLRVLLPMQNELMNIFLETVNPVFDMLFTLSKENIAVRKARDILLPRLMTGAITV